MLKKMLIAPANDMHVHFRQDDETMLKAVVQHTAKRCGRALVMPNTKVPVTTAEDVTRDMKKISQYSGYMSPWMTIKIDANCSPEKVYDAFKAGARAGKIYPEGMTTNSEGGITREMFFKPTVRFQDTLAAMESIGMILCLHGEMPGHEVLERESAFLPWVLWVRLNYPRLKVVLEHITTEDACDFVNSDKSGYLGATITVHHLVLTLDDVIGDKINPHNFCKPVAKRARDREALLRAATGDNPNFFLGTDSAPHLKGNKECSHGCAGVYSAPVMTEVTLEVFEERDALNKVENFMTRRAEAFYGMHPLGGTLTCERNPWTVPDIIDGIVPLYAGKTLNWRLV